MNRGDRATDSMKNTRKSIRLVLLTVVFLLWLTARSYCNAAPKEKALQLTDITDKPVSFQSEIGESGEFTWWLPVGAGEYVLPISAGVVVDASHLDLMR